MAHFEVDPDDDDIYSQVHRIKAGVEHPDLPEVQLDGWQCLIEEIGTLADLGWEDREDPNATYARVTWSDATLAALPAVYYLMCEREETEPDATVVQLADLEPAVDPPVLQASIATVVERFTARDNRIRQALNVPDGVEIPQFSNEIHAQYHAYLAERMQFPFEAVWEDDYGMHADQDEDPEHIHGPDCQHDHGHQHVHADGSPCDHDHDNLADYAGGLYDVTVTGLMPADEGDDTDCVFCTCLEQNRPIETGLIQIEPKHHLANAELISDYSYWLAHFGPYWDEVGHHPEDDRDEDFQPDPYFAAAFQAIKRQLMSGADDGTLELIADLQDETTEPSDSETFVRTTQKVGRNESCPCGSGKKFKKCCLREAK